MLCGWELGRVGMNHTAGSRNDLPLHVSDPPLHVLSSSWLSVKLPCKPPLPGAERTPLQCPLTSAGNQYRFLQIRTSPRKLPQSPTAPQFAVVFFLAGSSRPERGGLTLKKTSAGPYFLALCFIPSLWLQADLPGK